MQPMSKQRWRAHHSEPSTESISVRMHPAAVTQGTSFVVKTRSNYDFGGISGGPIIGIFETEQGLYVHALAGVIVEHPNYHEDGFSVEQIVGARVDTVTESGKIF